MGAGRGQVPLVDLDTQHAAIIEDLRAAFERVVASGAFVLGEEVERFEAEFAAYCGAAHCVAVGSGTAALTLAFRALGIGQGDEVIVPGHTFVATAYSVLHAGATPRFCDVDEGTGLIDLASAEQLVGPRTAAVVPVHLYGQVCDMDAVTRFAEARRLAVVEDAAHAHGATFRGRRAGSFGDAGAFSFYPSKNLGALGDGGAVCTGDAGVARRVRELRDSGRDAARAHVRDGFSERLDALQAAFLRVKLRRLDAWNEARRTAATLYRELLPPAATTLRELPESPCVYHLFPVRIPRRDEIAEQLRLSGISAGVHYSPELPRQPPFREERHAELPVAARWAREELSLPISESIQPPDVERVAHCLNDALEGLPC